MNILVVEDSSRRIPAFKAYVKRLEAAGQPVTVTFSKSPAGAIDYLRGATAPPDLVFLDYDLVGGKGSKVAFELVRLKIRPRVIVHSMNAMGSLWLTGYLMFHGFDVQRRPFYNLALDWTKESFA